MTAPAHTLVAAPMWVQCPYCLTMVRFRGILGEDEMASVERVATGMSVHLRFGCRTPAPRQRVGG